MGVLLLDTVLNGAICSGLHNRSFLGRPRGYQSLKSGDYLGRLKLTVCSDTGGLWLSHGADDIF